MSVELCAVGHEEHFAKFAGGFEAAALVRKPLLEALERFVGIDGERAVCCRRRCWQRS